MKRVILIAVILTLLGSAGAIYAAVSEVVRTLPAAVTIVSILPGDVNSDRVVDILDLTIVAANFNLSVPPAEAEADINGDAIVDIFDLVLVGINFGNTGSPWPDS